MAHLDIDRQHGVEAPQLVLLPLKVLGLLPVQLPLPLALLARQVSLQYSAAVQCAAQYSGEITKAMSGQMAVRWAG